MKENFNYDENMDDDNITITPIYDDTSDGTELIDDSNILSDSSDNDSEIEIIAENMEPLDSSFDIDEMETVDVGADFHIEEQENIQDNLGIQEQLNSDDILEDVLTAEDKLGNEEKADEKLEDVIADGDKSRREIKKDANGDDVEEPIDKISLEDSNYQFRDVASDDIFEEFASNEGISEVEYKDMTNSENVDFEFDDIAPYISKNASNSEENKDDKHSKKDKKKTSNSKKLKKGKKTKQSKFKRLPKWAQVACVIIICLAFVAGGSMVAYNTVLAGLVNFKDFSEADEQEEQFDTEETLGDQDNIEVVEADDFNWDIIQGNSKYDPNIYNILIIGGDNVSSSGFRGNSDTLIIVSIDKNTKKIKLSSIMRDTYVPIPDHRDNKINSAFATGGVPLAKKTIEENFKITIDSTVVINYTTFVKAINKLGGIDDVTINEKEANFINSETRKKGKSSNLSAGTVHLNAVQALNFARIRKISSDIYGHDDFGRTARQRFILNQLFKKYKDLSYTELAKLASMALGDLEIDQNLKKDMFLLLQVVLKFDTESLDEFRLPIDDGYTFASVPIPGSGRNMSVVKIDDYLQKNVDALHMFIYGDVDY